MKSTRNFARHPFGLIMMLKSLIIRLSYRIFSDPNGYRRTRPSYFRHLLSLLTGGLNPRPMFRPVVPPDEQQFPITLSSRKTRIRYPIATCIALASLLVLGGISEADPHKHPNTKLIKRPPNITGQWCLPLVPRVRSSDLSLRAVPTFSLELVVASFDPATGSYLGSLRPGKLQCTDVRRARLQHLRRNERQWGVFLD